MHEAMIVGKLGDTSPAEELNILFGETDKKLKDYAGCEVEVKSIYHVEDPRDDGSRDVLVFVTPEGVRIASISPTVISAYLTAAHWLKNNPTYRISTVTPRVKVSNRGREFLTVDFGIEEAAHEVG